MSVIPDDFKNYFISRNSLFFPDFEFVIKLSFPRVFVSYKITEGYYTDFNKFFSNIADVQYLEGKRPSESEHNQILTDIWNYITMENNPERNDYIIGDKLWGVLSLWNVEGIKDVAIPSNTHGNILIDEKLHVLYRNWSHFEMLL